MEESEEVIIHVYTRSMIVNVVIIVMGLEVE